MCIAPVAVDVRGLAVEIACRKCWQCQANLTKDWVGRCIAESKAAVATTVVSLTYGASDRIGDIPNDEAATTLRYRDVQHWLKRLRKGVTKNGVTTQFPLRYFAIGEYGERKGRSHWHVICFWQKNVPNYMHRVRNFSDPFWTKGYAFWDGDFSEKAVYYACKYLQKGASLESMAHMSKYPPLGQKYFADLAKNYARQGILPKNGLYSFPEVREKQGGLPRQFLMRDVTLDMFVSEFIEEWRRLYGSHPLDKQHSDFLQSWVDAVAPRVAADGFERRALGGKPFIPPPDGFGSSPYTDDQPDEIPWRFSELHNAYYCVDADGEVLWWSFDEKGKRAWRSDLRTESAAKELETAEAGATQYRRGRDGHDLV